MAHESIQKGSRGLRKERGGLRQKEKAEGDWKRKF